MKKKTYTVIVSRQVIETAAFEIKATSDEDAIQQAKKVTANFDAEDLEIDDEDWEYWDNDPVELESVHRGDAGGKAVYEAPDDDGPESSGPYCHVCSGPLKPGETCDCSEEEE